MPLINGNERSRKYNEIKFPLYQDLELSNYTGKGIRIAIVDSGIDFTHPNIREIRGGVQIDTDLSGKIYYGNDYNDITGHGTACAGIIREIAPKAELYSVRILDENHTANSKALIESLRWSIKMKMNLVNLSLGTTDLSYEEEIRHACNLAYQEGIILVAAAGGSDLNDLPAILPNVIGIKAAKCSSRYEYYYHPEENIEFSAYGNEQKLAWSNHDYISLGGASFAAAHITGFIALILEKFPSTKFQEIINILASKASPMRHSTTKKQNNGISILEKYHQNYSWIRKAALCPYNQEMHSFIRYGDLLSFKITGIADSREKLLYRKDASDPIILNPVGIEVSHDIKDAISDADTLILGRMNRTCWQNIILKSIEYNKNIYSFVPLPQKKYADIIAKAEQKELKICYPRLPEIFKTNLNSETTNNVGIPIIGCFSTCFCPGNFTIQLEMRRQLIRHGYKVSQISTETYSGLFGVEASLPFFEMGICSQNVTPQIIPFIEQILIDICMRNDPDIIVVGTQGGIIPYNLLRNHNIGSISNISFLYGTKPDAYILVVNELDPFDYISDTINALEMLGKGRMILLVIFPKTVYPEIYSAMDSSVVFQDILDNSINQLEERFGVPATEVFSSSGQNKLSKVILDFLR